MSWISKDSRSSKEKSMGFYSAMRESSHLYADILYALPVWGVECHYTGNGWLCFSHFPACA